MKAFIYYSHVYWLVQAALLQIIGLLINWAAPLHSAGRVGYSALCLSFCGPTKR